jgi:hypothetical protein
VWPGGTMDGMPHSDEYALVAYVERHPSAAAPALYDATDPAVAGAALRSAAARIGELRHPPGAGPAGAGRGR